MRRSVLALVLYALLTLLATHPLWQRLSDAVPGDIGDPVLNTYILAWNTHALVNDPLNIFNASIFYPLPDTLAYSENLIGDALIALPIILLSGEPVLAYNLTCLLSFVLAAFGMYLLMLYCTRNRRAAFVAAVAFAFAPYRLASLAHIQLLTVQWLPLLALLLFQMMRPVKESLRTSQFAMLLIFLWLQIASTLHGALFAALIIFVMILGRVLDAIRNIRHPATPRRDEAADCWLHPVPQPEGLSARECARHRTWTGATRMAFHVSPFPLIFFVVFIALLVPIGLPYLSVKSELRAARPPQVALSFLAQPSDFLAAYPWNRLLGTATEIFRQREGFTEEQTLFMGIVVPLLALFGLLKRRRGSRWNLLFGGLLVGALLFATSAWLVQAIPLASVMRVPARWGVVLSFALAGLCGLGVAKLLTAKTQSRKETPRGRRENLKTFAFFASSRFAALFVLVFAVFLEGFAAPIPLAQIGTLQAQPAVYQYLAQQAGHEAIIELPMYVAPDAEYAEGKRMYASALHWRPLVNGYSGFTPARQLTLAAQLKNFPDEPSLAALRELGRQGVRYVIVHAGEPGIPRREWTQTNRARAMQSGVLRFVQSFNDNDLFEIVAE